jgi:branched-chain amino acid aminotransferase
MAAKTITFHDGAWHEGNPPMLGPMVHSLWMASAVFDGARAFSGLAPDLARHCERVVTSAEALGMAPAITAAEIEALAWAGIEKFEAGAELYIRPLFYFADGFVTPDPETTTFMLTLFDAPLPEWGGKSACLSSFRRPSPEVAPTGAKASCLYPNVARAMVEARDRGYDMAVMLDGNGNVAEFSTSNLFIARDRVVRTPIANGTFLAGITRARVMDLLRQNGIEVVEETVRFDDVLDADEVFLTGNYPKVLPVVRVEERDYQEGPMARLARDLYFSFAEREGRKQAA